MAQHSGRDDVTDKVVLDPDVYCSLVKCAFNGAFQRKTEMNEHSLLFKQLVNTLVDAPSEPSQHNPPQPKTGVLSGNLKESIDAIKADFLDHYSLLYNLQEYSIKERLEILGRHAPVENTVAHETTRATHTPIGETTYAQRADAPEEALKEETSVSQGVLSMIDALKHKFETLNNRIEALDNEIEAEVGDPNLREWEYSKESMHLRGHHDLEGDAELCNHIRNLYAYLSHQAKINDQKIEAMRNRLITLQAHAKILSKRQPNDTRVAF
ncbi:hypothetical protein, conserved [Babesia bigemina]|uniref:Uncharacterized protein n=1 Tax=Babesia bigemina TaxID=5866 RepID=A0A061DA91_BABBI|nr:hypothetical protein, conserved [Babesia bigemina]CDR97631.1 hypothetical protein, conserved [Babesia bigemina]|eukprot:XP_012769817.1 hypothetical protein, conserved [Babesia bigemina]